MRTFKSGRVSIIERRESNKTPKVYPYSYPHASVSSPVNHSSTISGAWHAALTRAQRSDIEYERKRPRD